MQRRRFLALGGAALSTSIAGCSSDDDPDTTGDATDTPSSTPTSTPTATTDPLEDAAITIEGFNYPTEADDYDGDLPGVVMEESLEVEVIVNAPVSADGEYAADLMFDIEDADGEVVATETERIEGSTTSSSDGTIQIYRAFEFDAGEFEYAEHRVLAEAEDSQTGTEDGDRGRIELLYSNWEARVEVQGHMEDAKAILADAIDIYHDAGDGDWLDVTAASDADGAMRNVRGRAWESQPVSTDARQAAIDSSLDYNGRWDARISRIETERELIRSMAEEQRSLFSAHDRAIAVFEGYENGDRDTFIAPSTELADDVQDFEPWRDPVADYWAKVEQMEDDVSDLGRIETAAGDTRSGTYRYRNAEEYYEDGRYNDAEGAVMDAIENYEAALREIGRIDGFRALRRSCRRSVESLLEAAEDLRDDARAHQ